MYVCICMCVCTYVCVYMYIYVRMYVCVYVCVCTYVCRWMDACIYVLSMSMVHILNYMYCFHFCEGKLRFLRNNYVAIQNLKV
jgi:hypothetical protein